MLTCVEAADSEQRVFHAACLRELQGLVGRNGLAASFASGASPNQLHASLFKRPRLSKRETSARIATALPHWKLLAESVTLPMHFVADKPVRQCSLPSFKTDFPYSMQTGVTYPSGATYDGHGAKRKNMPGGRQSQR